jgi:hypothetical protein
MPVNSIAIITGETARLDTASPNLYKEKELTHIKQLWMKVLFLLSALLMVEKSFERQLRMSTKYAFLHLPHNSPFFSFPLRFGVIAKLLDAIVRLHDYSRYTEAKGAFAVLFPEELRRPWTEEMLEEIAADPKLKYVATVIEGKSASRIAFQSGGLPHNRTI